jgi:hypothetical protein
MNQNEGKQHRYESLSELRYAAGKTQIDIACQARTNGTRLPQRWERGEGSISTKHLVPAWKAYAVTDRDEPLVDLEEFVKILERTQAKYKQTN